MSGEPDVVVQVVDATNLERNLYLALQVIETGLPVVVALNMADLVEKNGDKIDTDKLSKKLGCPVMMISALKNKGITELFEQVKKSAASKGQVPEHKFDSSIEDVLTHIENNLPASVSANKRRYYAVKLFERDADACKLINLTKEKAARVEELVAQCEQDCDDDAESIITGERYGVIAHIIDECMTKAPAKMSTSEKIDRVVTNRILGLPIFVVIMFCVYYIAVSTLGGTVTDFTNDQLFGTDGWYVLGQGRDAYDAAVEAAGDNADSVDPAQYGPYVPGITTVVHDALVAGGTEDGAWSIRWSATHRRRPGRHLRLRPADVPAVRHAVLLGGLRYMARVASSWTACSAALACPVSPSSPCLCPRAAVSPASWLPRPSRTRRTAV